MKYKFREVPIKRMKIYLVIFIVIDVMILLNCIYHYFWPEIEELSWLILAKDNLTVDDVESFNSLITGFFVETFSVVVFFFFLISLKMFYLGELVGQSRVENTN